MCRVTGLLLVVGLVSGERRKQGDISEQMISQVHKNITVSLAILFYISQEYCRCQQSQKWPLGSQKKLYSISGWHSSYFFNHLTTVSLLKAKSFLWYLKPEIKKILTAKFDSAVPLTTFFFWTCEFLYEMEPMCENTTAYVGWARIMKKKKSCDTVPINC